MVTMVRVNLFKEIATTSQRQEILDWYHLKENLYKVGGCRKRIKQAEALLWRGRVVDIHPGVNARGFLRLTT